MKFISTAKPVGLFESLSINIDNWGQTSASLNDAIRGIRGFTSHMPQLGHKAGLIANFQLDEQLNELLRDPKQRQVTDQEKQDIEAQIAELQQRLDPPG